MFEECFNCEISGEKAKLFTAISKEGIVKVCKECAEKNNLPILKDVSKLPNQDPPPRESVYKRLSRIAGVTPKIKKPEAQEEARKKQDEKLKKIAEKNYLTKISDEPKPDFLIDNFHWKIMRARRLRHISQGQLAKAIAEPEIAVKMIEKGILSRGNYDLISKIEDHLGIKITKEEFTGRIEEERKKIGFDPISTRKLTISDLKEIQGGETPMKSEFQEETDLEEDILQIDDELLWEDD